MDKIKTELAEYLSKYFKDTGFINIGIGNNIDIIIDSKCLYTIVGFKNQLFSLFVWIFDSKIEVKLKTTIKPDEVKYLDLSIEMNYKLNDNLDTILESIKSDVEKYFPKFIKTVEQGIKIIGERNERSLD